MKWILIVMALDGSISSATFGSEATCSLTVARLHILAARHILNTDGYEPFVEAFCVETQS